MDFLDAPPAAPRTTKGGRDTGVFFLRACRVCTLASEVNHSKIFGNTTLCIKMSSVEPPSVLTG